MRERLNSRYDYADRARDDIPWDIRGLLRALLHSGEFAQTQEHRNPLLNNLLRAGVPDRCLGNRSGDALASARPERVEGCASGSYPRFRPGVAARKAAFAVARNYTSRSGSSTNPFIWNGGSGYYSDGESGLQKVGRDNTTRRSGGGSARIRCWWRGVRRIARASIAIFTAPRVPSAASILAATN